MFLGGEEKARLGGGGVLVNGRKRVKEQYLLHGHIVVVGKKIKIQFRTPSIYARGWH